MRRNGTQLMRSSQPRPLEEVQPPIVGLAQAREEVGQEHDAQDDIHDEDDVVDRVDVARR